MVFQRASPTNAEATILCLHECRESPNLYGDTTIPKKYFDNTISAITPIAIAPKHPPTSFVILHSPPIPAGFVFVHVALFLVHENSNTAEHHRI